MYICDPVSRAAQPRSSDLSLGGQAAKAQISAPLFINNHGASGKPLNFFVPQFLYLSHANNGYNNSLHYEADRIKLGSFCRLGTVPSTPL